MQIRLKWSKKNPGRVSWIPGSPPNVLCLLPYLPLHHRPNHCRHHHREISGWTYILVNIFSYPHHCSHHMPNYHWDVSNQTYVCQRLVISNISTIITTTNIPFWSPTPPGTVPPNSISPPVQQSWGNSGKICRHFPNTLSSLEHPKVSIWSSKFDSRLSTLFFVKGRYQWPHAA